ncbi:alpha-mannosidase [Allonocardiopsis opalescens]|uniref:alpha-mannosidase n=1 Tax=Allonocardiopsis opalescens TaxID=1144618 RepID=A0A2T0Q080_9ACTN|nr:glycoside hydrolase family 38 C-terminal domain-containing protein [Allonocardiopsis opalescens]PRX97073.1 alpha-mannosidase [Allonocardiopsis opalescens]
MHDDRRLIEERVERVLRERIRPAVHRAVAPFGIEVWHAPGEPVPVAEALAADYAPAAPGDLWGPPWGTSWFRFTGRVPDSGGRLEAVIDLGFDTNMPGFQAEGLAYRPDGTPVKGLSPRNSYLPVAACGGRPGEELVFYVEAAANPVILGHDQFVPTALGRLETAGREPLYRLRSAGIAERDETVAALVADIEVLDGLARQLAAHEPRRQTVLRALERALDRLDLRDVPGSADAARKELADVLASPAHASAHRLSAIGHAHIDSAWLWPLRETVRKVARTAANVTALMDERPEFKFAMSQAQQWAWLRDHHPKIFERVKEKVRAGQFLPVGGMWVESDTNMPGGEAMARQFSHGKRFFLDELGVETQEVWLPDSFGYSAALPQLIALSGSQYFLTQKISWNQTNKFPHHTFAWEGIDGTRMFTHFPPIDTYNSELTAPELAHATRNYAEHGRGTRSLVPFGYGDGGGGPTREMLDRAARTADLEGSPRVAIETPAAFFAAAQAEYPNAPVWAGELYLEFHRGTYTSQARTKQGNRRSEHLLREAELWAATAALRTGLAYPYEDLDRIWKKVLLNQFHDILPGSSIAWVHREAERTYAEIAAELEEIIDRAVTALAGDGGGTELVFNAAPHARGGAPALGAAPRTAPDGGAVRAEAADGGTVLDNGLVRVTVDERGLITSLRDLRADREVVAPGAAANLLQLHPDLPNRWDAWDVDSFYRNTVTDLTGADEVALVRTDPDAAEVRVVRSFGSSRVEQLLRLRAGSPNLEIDTEVDWHESETFLKAAFPLDIHTDRSTSEIQFGHVHRPAHTNTSWDAARFEICAHRFLHVGEPDYGVALVNATSYGHDVTRHPREGGGTTTTVRLSLLRAPRFPDPETDQGRHSFRHALVPGAAIADAVTEGYRINLPERTAPGTAPVAPLVAVDNDAAIVEAVKLADDRSGDVVVRLYESRGARATATITPSFPTTAIQETDLLERPTAPTALTTATPEGATLSLRPFQVVTLRFGREG